MGNSTVRHNISSIWRSYPYAIAFAASIIGGSIFAVVVLRFLGTKASYAIPDSIAVGFIVIGTLGVIAVSILRYLSVDTIGIRNSEAIRTDRRIEALDRKITSVLVGDRPSFVREVKDNIRASVSAEFINDMQANTAAKAALAGWEKFEKDSLSRMFAEVRAQGRRGNVNLSIGIFTAFSGIALLTYLLFHDSPRPTAVNEFAIAFLPRVSIVAIIEVFAYFFLRLYKVSLSEIKYFQNECTNLECRVAAIKLAIATESVELTSKLVHALVAVDRNPVLVSGSSTLELEKDRLDATAVSLSVGQLMSIAAEAVARDRGKPTA